MNYKKIIKSSLWDKEAIIFKFYENCIIIKFHFHPSSWSQLVDGIKVGIGPGLAQNFAAIKSLITYGGDAMGGVIYLTPRNDITSLIAKWKLNQLRRAQQLGYNTYNALVEEVIGDFIQLKKS